MQDNLPYIITGIVAVIVTIYLFVALLFPEKF
jgi:K+-transporting ATPase KdpF subunit